MTIETQFEVYMKQLTTRKRSPIKGATVAAYHSYYRTWVGPLLGKMDVKVVENGVMKKFVSQLAEKNLSASSIASITQLVKGIVSSLQDENGNSLVPRAWNADFIDSPLIKDQKAPTITSQGITYAIERGGPIFGPLFALLGASGLRIGEIRALKVGPQPESSYWDPKESKLVIRKALYLDKEQSPKTESGIREVDLNEEINEYLMGCLGPNLPIQGYMFSEGNGEPLNMTALYEGAKKCKVPGFHAFRRYRITHLENMSVPLGLINFWAGHATKGDIHNRYVKLDKDIQARKDWAQRAGLGFSLTSEKKDLTERFMCATV